MGVGSRVGVEVGVGLEGMYMEFVLLGLGPRGRFGIGLEMGLGWG